MSLVCTRATFHEWILTVVCIISFKKVAIHSDGVTVTDKLRGLFS